ncbi:hypothetical protein Tco_0719946 [Tanacetum coccineum]
MDDSNITMEEYIRLEEEKAQKRGKVFNWETAKNGKIWYDEDVHDLRSVETEFPAIVFNDNLTSNETLFCEPTISSFNNNEIDFRISFDESNDEDYTILRIDFSTEPTLCPQHIDEFDLKDETSLSEYDEVEQNVLYFNYLFPFNIIYPDDLKSDKDNDDNEIDMIQSSGNLYVPFGIPLDPKRYFKDGDCTRMLRRPRTFKIYNLCTNLVNFTNMALPPIDQRYQYLRFEGLQYTEGDIDDFEMSLAKIYRREVHKVQVFDFGGLPDLMAEELSNRMLMEHRDAQGQSVFGEAMLDLDIARALQFQLGRFRRHMSWRELIACSIAGRSQAPKKVTITDLFYLRGMDVGSVNIPYLLARYLRLFASGRKQGAMISGGQFVALLAEHFGLLTEERLLGLTMIVRDLPVIDMAKLVRLEICVELDDTCAWVASRPERQPDAAAGALEAAEDAPVADEGALAVPAPVQATQPPPLVAGSARTIAQRLARVDKDVHEIHEALGEQREIFDSMARDFSRFSTWMVFRLSQMMSQAGVKYTSYADFQIPYARRTKRRTDGASTSTAQQDEQQPDP